LISIGISDQLGFWTGIRLALGGAVENDLQYYSRRAAEEHQAAAMATSQAAKRAHKTLAEKYTGIVEGRTRIPGGDSGSSEG
jgi:hypothetical protein